MFKNSKKKYYTALTICVVLYITAVVAYAFWSNHDRKKLILAEIDEKLLISAKSLKYMLAKDFQDRAVNEKSIAFDEELINRKKLNSFVKETDFTWAYTLVERDGKFYFSAPTVSEKEAKERKSWYFYPYNDIPEEFIRAYRERIPSFVNYSDQWGSYRSVAVPELSPGGRVYLSCMDYDITYLNQILKNNILKSVSSAIFFMIFSLPFIIIFRFFFRSYSIRLKEINDELAEHKENLEGLVTIRTAELTDTHNRLEEEKNRLAEALKDVNALSGLLPICSSCKKIRDDSGYWNQIEKYIQEHSEAKFSHSLCPDCVKKHYPDYAD